MAEILSTLLPWLRLLRSILALLRHNLVLRYKIDRSFERTKKSFFDNFAHPIFGKLRHIIFKPELNFELLSIFKTFTQFSLLTFRILDFDFKIAMLCLEQEKKIQIVINYFVVFKT